jgi:hypothetical protein
MTSAPAGDNRSHQALAEALDNTMKLRREELDWREKPYWRQSIVDLMKILRLDSSEEARTLLALAVGYDDDVNDSRIMNIWLRAYVEGVIAAVGGDLTGSSIASNSST